MNKFFLSLFLAIFLIFTFSCNKDQNFALDILPEQDLINTNFVDTFTVNVRTRPYTHIQTLGKTAALIGSYKDPIFGYTKASVGLQIQQFSYPDFTDSAITYTVDSVFLLLKLDPGYTPYGKIYNPLPLYVFPINEPLTIGQRIYADDSITEFTDFSDTLGYTDFSVFSPGSDTILKIYIDQDLAYEFINNADYYFFNDSSHFTDRFPGFIITPGNNFYDAAIYKIPFPPVIDPDISVNDIISGLYIYYHPDTVADTSYLYKLPATGMSMYFTLIEHDYSGTNIFNSNNDSVVYLQTAGTAIDISFPYINSLKDKVIHKAELIFQLEDPQYTEQTSFGPPQQIYLVGTKPDDSTAAPVFLEDYFDRQRVEYKGFGLQFDHYSINVTHLLQKIINNPDQDTLNYSIIDLFDNQQLTRAVLTTQHNSRPLKLIVFYSNY